MKTNDLEDRLINFAVFVINLMEGVKRNYAGSYYSNQLVRSSGSLALNYGEARSAEFQKDFVASIITSKNNNSKIVNR